jgi:hypothetical protein
VQRDAVADNFAERQIDVITEPVVTEAFIGVAGRKNETETRRERRHAFAFDQRLQPIVEPDVRETVLIFRKRVGNCVGELVCLTEYEGGPLINLRKSV